MQEYEKPYLVSRFGRETYVGWERLYELTPGTLADLLLKNQKEARILYYYDSRWWEGCEQWCCPDVILDNVFGVILCFQSGNLYKILLVDLVSKESLAEYPATETKLLLPCKKLLAYGRKYLRNKGKRWYEDYRKGNAYLYAQSGYPPYVLRLELDADCKEWAKNELNSILSTVKRDACFDPYPPFEQIYDSIIKGLCIGLESQLGFSTDLIQSLKDMGFTTFEREVCFSLYSITRQYYGRIPLKRSLGLIATVLILYIKQDHYTRY